MNSATKVGEIFTKAGESFHKMADMTMMLDAKAQEVNTTGVKKQATIEPKQTNGMTKIVMQAPASSSSNR